METCCLEGLESAPPRARGCVLTIGNFDGVHIGHQRILLQCRLLARQEQAPVVAVTFDPPPQYVLRPEAAPPLLASRDENCRLLCRHGADMVLTIKTDLAFLQLTAAEFIENVLARLAPRHIVEGQDFFFGRGRIGSVETLIRMGHDRGFETHVVDSVTLMFRQGERRVSSSLIRELIADGDVEDAALCLGRPHAMRGAVVTGAAQGRLMDYPTINLDPRAGLAPGDGVYGGKATIDDRTYVAAISVGPRPTLHPQSRQRVVEAFLLDAAGDFYGRVATLTFVKRIRGQRRFESVEALKEQIGRDIEAIRQAVKP
jgi:riboflavin kinase/FMN adenylyltransferase